MHAALELELALEAELVPLLELELTLDPELELLLALELALLLELELTLVLVLDDELASEVEDDFAEDVTDELDEIDILELLPTGVATEELPPLQAASRRQIVATNTVLPMFKDEQLCRGIARILN